MEKLVIGNEVFTVHKSKYINSIENLHRYAHRTLLQCYERPSTTKQHIYEKWLKWSYENNVQFFGVSSYNCHAFSLQGLIDMDGESYILYITQSYNKAYKI